MEQYWIYEPIFFHRNDKNGRKVFDILLEELTPYLEQGTVTMRGQEHLERHLNAYFTNTNKEMKYSGKIMKPVKPPENSYIADMLRVVSSEEFKQLLIERYGEQFNNVNFNSMFVNLYRSPQTTDKPDKLGPHSDKVNELSSEIILSATFCQEQGARAFRFHEKPSEKVIEEIELPDGSALFMLTGCQDRYKHSVSDRKYNSKKELITGARVNITFRCFKT